MPKRRTLSRRDGPRGLPAEQAPVVPRALERRRQQPAPTLQSGGSALQRGGDRARRWLGQPPAALAASPSRLLPHRAARRPTARRQPVLTGPRQPTQWRPPKERTLRRQQTVQRASAWAWPPYSGIVAATTGQASEDLPCHAQMASSHAAASYGGGLRRGGGDRPAGCSARSRRLK